MLDASAAVEWLLHTRAGLEIDGRILSEDVHVPHLIDVEVAQALRRLVSHRTITAGRAEGALQDLSDTACIRYPHYFYVPRIWELRNNLSAYDAMYVALAESLDATLITCDSKLAAAPGHRARIELVT